jgi:hypothetical protein
MKEEELQVEGEAIEPRASASDTASLSVTIPAVLVVEAAGPYSSPTGTAVTLNGSFTGGTGPFTSLWTASPSGQITFANAALLNTSVSFEGVSVGPHSYTLTLSVTDSLGFTSRAVLGGDRA